MFLKVSQPFVTVNAALPSGCKLLVTGANDLVAAWVVRELLENGFLVRGTIRSDAKGIYLRKQFASYGDGLEIAVVPDIERVHFTRQSRMSMPSSIQYTASPYRFDAENPKELIDPAVRVTTSISHSAMKHGSASGHHLVLCCCTSKPWGRMLPNHMKYSASKTLAEKAACGCYNQNKEKLEWDLITLCPPAILAS
ncbi:unnamed protein product [Somion occarium]|uniref:Uncharacterized protein n=1 Tax=Somion occarium TaxID=3059160 RepID=A0ABP1DLB3_9APHY